MPTRPQPCTVAACDGSLSYDFELGGVKCSLCPIVHWFDCEMDARRWLRDLRPRAVVDPGRALLEWGEE